jgi:hypothetical protein
MTVIASGGSPPSAVSEQDIADAVKAVLASSPEPHLLSTLGNVLSKKFERPIRDILGETKLRTIIERYLGNEVQFQGGNSRLEVRILPVEPHRYNRKFWTAFSKPVLSGRRRWIEPNYPFNFHDYEDGEEPPKGYLHIESSLVPAPEIPKDDRDVKIREIIQSWCAGVKRPAFDFSITPETKPVRRTPETGNAERNTQPFVKTKVESGIIHYRVDALIKFIDAIPEAERSRYSLPLDLIRRFVD